MNINLEIKKYEDLLFYERKPDGVEKYLFSNKPIKTTNLIPAKLYPKVQIAEDSGLQDFHLSQMNQCP